MTALRDRRPDATEIATIKEQLPYVERHSRGVPAEAPGILAFWLVGWSGVQGQMTKAPGSPDTTELHRRFERRPRLGAARGHGQLAVRRVFGAISDALDSVVLFFQELIAIPAFPRPVPEVGWLGVIALAAWVAYAFAGLRLDDPGRRHVACPSVSSTSGRTAWTR